MSIALPSLRAALFPGQWVRNELWRRARAVPSLDLRFADNKILTDAVTGQQLVTFTRASSGTYVGSDGLLKTATTNEARFDHNPTTGESLGLLVEEQRTNLLLRSEEFDTASWTLGQTSVSANVIESPTGNLTADKLIENTNSSTHLIQQIIAHTSGTIYTTSCFVKAAERTFISLTFGSGFTGTQANSFFDLSNGTTPTPGATIVSLGNGWFRCSFTITATASASSAVQFRLATSTSVANYTGDGTSGIFLWGAQLEVGAFPTSYIPTTTATVTRSADVASITGANFSIWYRQDEGTLYAEGAVPVGATGSRALASLDDATNNERIQIGHNGTTAIRNLVVDGGSTQFLPSVIANSFPPGEYRKLALAGRVDDFAAISTLGTVATGSSGTMPTPTQLQIGIGAGQSSINSPIKRLTYWPQRLSNSTLQAVTQ